MFTPPRLRKPLPLLVSPVAVPFEIAPPMVKDLELPTVTVRDPAVDPSDTAPVPRLRSLPEVPNEKSPFHVWALFVDEVIDAPEVLLIVPPLITKVPLPRAEALLMLRVPALNAKVFPDPNVLAPLKVSVPEPMLVRLNAPDTTELMFKIAPEFATSKFPSARMTVLRTPLPPPLLSP